jgi:nucleotide-binding universal stress UspA family protein
MRILIPVDGSAHADAALDFVASRSTLLGQEPVITLINVQPALSARVTRAIGREEAKTYQRAQADEVLRPALDRLKQAGVAARASYALGGRAEVIGTAAQRGRADLIVMGSRGLSALKGLLFGSTTNAVLASCTKPLLVVRGAKLPQRDSLAVGIAVDGSRYGLAAVSWSVRHRTVFGTEPRIELIHVREGGLPEPLPGPGPVDRGAPSYVQVGDDDASAGDFDKALGVSMKRLAKAGLDARPVRLRGPSAGEAIAAYARRRRLDLLVMGSHGQGAFKSLVLGSVTTRVAARCETPLLLIREPARSLG